MSWERLRTKQDIASAVPAKNARTAGITLLEMLLVIAIMASMFIALARYTAQQGEDARIEHAVVQINQIFDAATAFYTANGRWPDGAGCSWTTLSGSGNELQPKYLPGTAMKPPWPGSNYMYYSCDLGSAASGASAVPTKGVFILKVEVSPAALGQKLADKLTLVSIGSGAIFPYIQIPTAGLNSDINSAIHFNYAGLYHHGACIPVPQCPAVTVGTTITSTSAQLFLLPVSVSGANDDSSTNVYPISSFTAYASGTAASAPAACVGSTSSPTCDAATGTTTGFFWRACMQIITERGDVSVTRTDAWGDNATMAAFTRCVPSSEKSGSDFSVFSN